ncbi:MAG: hypothetical protein Q9201_003490 [Fulgogasparrea decipioides]
MSKSNFARHSAEIDRNINSLPTEILDKIITLVISNDTPVHLEYLMEKAKDLTAFDLFGKTPHNTTKLDRFQLAHQREWVFVNSVNRSWRFTGQKAFFNQKTFVITTSLMRSLAAGHHKLLTSPDHSFNILEDIRHVIAPMSSYGAASNFLTLPHYNAFSNLQSVDILTFVRMNDILCDYCNPGYWAYSANQEPDRELMECLAGIGFRVNQLEIRQRCIPARLRGAHMQQLQKDVFPYLRFVSSQKAKSKAREVDA